MTEKLTVIQIPNAKNCSGLMEHGEESIDQMIAHLRNYSKNLRAQADEIDATPDKDFNIKIVRGVHVSHHIRTLQEGRKRL